MLNGSFGLFASPEHIGLAHFTRNICFILVGTLQKNSARNLDIVFNCIWWWCCCYCCCFIFIAIDYCSVSQCIMQEKREKQGNEIKQKR